MKSSELRIGNWVEKFTDLGDSLGYSTVLPKEFLAIHTKPERVAPIPLTEEILLKCPEITKCTYHEETWRIRDPKSQFHIVKHNDRFVFRGVGMSVIYVDTLHHLQNLVYVNTLKELEVEL